MDFLALKTSNLKPVGFSGFTPSPYSPCLYWATSPADVVRPISALLISMAKDLPCIIFLRCPCDTTLRCALRGVQLNLTAIALFLHVSKTNPPLPGARCICRDRWAPRTVLASPLMSR